MILQVKDVTRDFAIERGIFKKGAGVVRALDGVSFSLPERACLGVVGGSGSGKSTLAKVILKLIPPTSGEVIFDPERIRNFRKDAQIIFQNPYNSLNPRMSIFQALAEPLLIHRIVPRKVLKDRIIELLKMVNLGENCLKRRPAEFSGGQRQRICIARVLAVEPKLLVLDEPVSSLDLIIQAQILDMLKNLKEKLGLTFIFISHNLAVIKYMASSIITLDHGRKK